MTSLVAIDIGGTHARFALATIGTGGIIEVGEPITLPTSDYAGLQEAWAEFKRRCHGPAPNAAAIAIAAPMTGETVRMTNNKWVLRTGTLAEDLGLDAVTVLNDFAAVAHAVAHAPADQLLHLAGPDLPLPDRGTISVIGPGTGLGVAHFHRFASSDGRPTYVVQATEGGHIGFAPVDDVDDQILAQLRARYGRVSVERVVAGPGMVEIYAALAALENRAAPPLDDRSIWQQGLAREDDLAVAAIDRFCVSLGSVAGDYALAHGASAVVIAGGLGYRLRDWLPSSGFADRFRFKGRYEQMMAGLPVKLMIHPQPGLLGAVAAFQIEHGLKEPSQ